MKGIADTGFIVAFARRNDEHHVWAVDVAKRITEPLLTCEAVLADRNPDLAVLCLIRMSELHPARIVLTVDNDFRVYRRNRREAIPIHMPPYRR